MALTVGEPPPRATVYIPPRATESDENTRDGGPPGATARTHARTRVPLLPLASLCPSLSHFGAYDSRDRLHSVFSVNDWARGPIRWKRGERARASERAREREREREGVERKRERTSFERRFRPLLRSFLGLFRSNRDRNRDWNSR